MSRGVEPPRCCVEAPHVHSAMARNATAVKSQLTGHCIYQPLRIVIYKSTETSPKHDSAEPSSHAGSGTILCIAAAVGWVEKRPTRQLDRGWYRKTGERPQAWFAPQKFVQSPTFIICNRCPYYRADGGAHVWINSTRTNRVELPLEVYDQGGTR